MRYPDRSIVAGCLLRVGDRILLSRRAIPPRTGFWTIPGGYVDEGESTEHAARRELEEEAGVSVAQAQLLAIYEMPQISQVLFLYSAIAESCIARAGLESSEITLCRPRDAPWHHLAFATDRRTLYRLLKPDSISTVEFGQFRWGKDNRIRMTTHVEWAKINDRNETI